MDGRHSHCVSVVPPASVMLDRLGLLGLATSATALGATWLPPSTLEPAVLFALFVWSFGAAAAAFLLARLIELCRFVRQVMLADAGAPQPWRAIERDRRKVRQPWRAAFERRKARRLVVAAPERATGRQPAATGG